MFQQTGQILHESNCLLGIVNVFEAIFIGNRRKYCNTTVYDDIWLPFYL